MQQYIEGKATITVIMVNVFDIFNLLFFPYTNSMITDEVE